MNRKVPLSIGFVVVILGLFAWRNSDHLPPRRPYKIARVVSGLPVPKDARVLEFRDEWSENGDGIVKIVLQLTPAQFEDLIGSRHGQNYQVANPEESEVRLIQSLLGTPVRGPYRFSGSMQDGYELVLFDPQTWRMYVALTVQ
jgi:hypothetical protein